MAYPRLLGKSCGFSSGKYRFGMFRNEPTPQLIHQTLPVIMKYSFKLIILTLFLNYSVQGQTKVDECISINIPGDVIKLDTIVKKISLLQYYSKNETEAYMIQRLEIDSKESELNSLPSDLKSLRKTYHEILRGQIRSMKEAGFEFRDSTEFKIDKYFAYNIAYHRPESGTQNAESNIIMLNENAYISTYINRTDFNETNKNEFLNSIKIDSINNPRQMIGNSAGFKSGYIIGKIFIYGLFIFGIIYFIRQLRKK
jgi:hypothetical protein